MKKYIWFSFLIFIAGKESLAIPQSGIWRSGGAANYSLLVPDSLSLFYISIQEQKVFIQLYPGFAVVKGIYWLKNSGEDTINITAGYPFNAEYESDSDYRLNIAFFDDQYCLKVSQDGKDCEIAEEGNRTWKNIVLPHSVTKVETWLLVETNSSQIREGWTESNENLLIYFFQSPWRPIIEKGEVYVQLMGEIEMEDLHGISPDSLFMLDAERKILCYKFSNLNPVNDQFNIIISYGEQLASFYFYKEVKKSESYFTSIDQFEKLNPATLKLKNYKAGNPFPYDSEFNNPMLLLMLLLGGIVVLIILVALTLAGVFKSKKTSGTPPLPTKQ
ncbi:MAG: hypothetical protein M3R17_00090 [Bacteroidota bacterium]|nr:hypothetical protein [Bacteroidota bacterium]